MGISGLLPLLKDAQEEVHISKYKGKVLGVDAYVWLHRGAYGCAQQLALGQKTNSYVNFAMNKVNMLKYHGITPYIVFDGGPLPAKAKTEEERAKRRRDNLAQAKLHLSQGRTQQAREYFVKCVDVTPAMAFQLIKALRAAGVDYIVAPYEADAQLAYLERRGTIDGIITEDSDLIVFGCKTVLYKMNDQGRCLEVLHQNRNKCKSIQLATFTDAHFRQMAILSGCDYLDSIPGMGLKTAYRLLKQCGSVARALSAARMEGMRIPLTYQKDFEKAEKTFVYQRVFHRSSTTGQFRMVTLTPCNGTSNIDDEDCIGPIISDRLVNAIALGDMDPITKEPIMDLIPSPPRRTQSNPVSTSTGFYATPKAKTNRDVPVAGQKTLDTFFSRSQSVQKSTKVQADPPARQPFKAITNVASASNATEDTLPVPDEKSKYFISHALQSSPSLDQFEAAQLATFTPTQSRRLVKRSMSSDSGEISSPASSAKKRNRDQMMSSPLVDESPSTSPSLTRPRKRSTGEASFTKFDSSKEDSDIEEEDASVDVGFLQRFAFQQQTPVPQKSVTTGNHWKREASASMARSASNSSNKKAVAMLQFNDDEVEDVFNGQTPTLQRTQSESSRIITTGRHIPLKRMQTDITD